MSQGSFDFDGPTDPPRRRRRTIQERFWEFHVDHPDVWDHLVSMGRQLRARGFRHYGIGSMWEAMRWHLALKYGPDAAGYKLNDHYRSRYARLLADIYPEEFGEFFEFRELKTE